MVFQNQGDVCDIHEDHMDIDDIAPNQGGAGKFTIFSSFQKTLFMLFLSGDQSSMDFHNRISSWRGSSNNCES
jgi:hypothetical protein